VFALLALALAAPPIATTGHPTCRATDMQAIEKALVKMEPARQHVFALVGVAQACAMPEPLAKGARDISASAPEQHTSLESRAITQALPQWMAACPGGIQTLQRMARAAPSTRALTLWRECKMDRFGVAQAARNGMSPSPLGLISAHLVFTRDPKVSPLLLQALLLAPR
jgi:hypothetical protein